MSLGGTRLRGNKFRSSEDKIREKKKEQNATFLSGRYTNNDISIGFKYIYIEIPKKKKKKDRVIRRSEKGSLCL